MTTTRTVTTAPSEIWPLAKELAASLARHVEIFERHFHRSHEDAVKDGNEGRPDERERILQRPPDQLTWLDLHRLSRTDPELTVARWEEMKSAALKEIQSGHRAAETIETTCNGVDNAWHRAQFIALRAELAAEWQPRNGVERQLIDTMAQAQTTYLVWLQTLTTYTNLECVSGRKTLMELGKWECLRQSDADALDQAAGMVDRFNRIFLRTLRALRDLRRQNSAVIHQSGGQLNVAQQQVNVAEQAPNSAAGTPAT
jgi:hypothetical protein